MMKCGLGLRRPFILEVEKNIPAGVDFFEIAPENYMNRGGRVGAAFESISKRLPMIAHGLMLSIGSADELNWAYLKELKKFIRAHQFPFFTDHLAVQSYEGRYFHDLLPLPFTEEAINHVSKRILTVQDFLEVPMGIENISFYGFPEKTGMTELEFISEILSRTGSFLLLDVNNVYVNATNHSYDPFSFLDSILKFPVRQIHVAGHFTGDDGFLIDTHGADVIDPVWKLLEYTLQKKKVEYIVLERDNNIPELEVLLKEFEMMKRLVSDIDIKK